MAKAERGEKWSKDEVGGTREGGRSTAAGSAEERSGAKTVLKAVVEVRTKWYRKKGVGLCSTRWVDWRSGWLAAVRFREISN